MFLGNLASEKTDKYELAQVFSQFGNIHEIVIREAYGFIQFDSVDAIQAAIAKENGRIIGGIALGMPLFCFSILLMSVLQFCGVHPSLHSLFC